MTLLQRLTLLTKEERASILKALENPMQPVKMTLEARAVCDAINLKPSSRRHEAINRLHGMVHLDA